MRRDGFYLTPRRCAQKCSYISVPARYNDGISASDHIVTRWMQMRQTTTDDYDERQQRQRVAANVYRERRPLLVRLRYQNFGFDTIQISMRHRYQSVNTEHYKTKAQVYLLTPMDCATLPRAKLTIIAMHAECRLITTQLRAIFKALSQTDGHLSVVCIYMYAEAQTPLGRFVVYILYK